MRRKEQDRQLLTIAVGAWILMGVIIFYAHVHVTAEIDNQNKRNAFLDEEITKVNKEIKEIADIKKQRADLIARMNVIYELQADRSQVVHLFDELARKLPEGMFFTTMKDSRKNILLQGVAQSNARVSALMRNLASSDWFANPELEVITVKNRGGVRVSEFSLKVKQVAKQQKKLTDSGT